MTKRQQALDLHNTGATTREICEALGVAKTTVYYWTKPEYADKSQLRKKLADRERPKNNFRSYCVGRLKASRKLAIQKGIAACTAAPDELVAAFTGKCTICTASLVMHTPKIGKHHISLDHDHKTGQFRGWLCASCNRGLGFLGDDPLLIAERLIAYANQIPPLTGSGDGTGATAANALDASRAL